MTTNNQTSIASLAKKRRTYSAEFKQQIVQACKAPGTVANNHEW
ncbi:transposase [Acinetobacter baumannii]|nr:transposase [Acinetobacter baumannii]